MRMIKLLFLPLLATSSINGLAQEILVSPTIQCQEILTGPKRFKEIFLQLIEVAESQASFSPSTVDARSVFSVILRDGAIVEPDDLINVFALLGFTNLVFGNHGVSEVIQSKLILDSFDTKTPWTDVYGILSRAQVNERRLQMTEFDLSEKPNL